MLNNKSSTFNLMKTVDGTHAAVTQQTTLPIKRGAEGPLSGMPVPDLHVKPTSGTTALHTGNEKCRETDLSDDDFGMADDGIITIGQQAVNKLVADKLQVGQSGELLCQAKFNVTDKSDLVVVEDNGSTTVHVAKKGLVFPQTKGPPTYPTAITVTAIGYATMVVGPTTITPTNGVLSYTDTITDNRDLTVILKAPATDSMLANLSPPVANGYKEEGSDAHSDQQEQGETLRDPKDLD